jgi:hypothetical protein
MKKLLYTVYLEVIPCLQLLLYQSITCCTHPPHLLSDAETSCLRSRISLCGLVRVCLLLDKTRQPAPPPSSENEAEPNY